MTLPTATGHLGIDNDTTDRNALLTACGLGWQPVPLAEAVVILVPLTSRSYYRASKLSLHRVAPCVTDRSR
jgi:hypothetical protein